MAAENPFGFGFLLNTIYVYLQKPVEITIVNDENSKISNFLYMKFLPESILITIKNKSQLDVLSKFAFFAGKNFEDKTSVFVCKNFSCSLPMYTVNDVESTLDSL